LTYIVTVPVTFVDGVNEYVYEPGALCFSVAVTVVQLVAQREKVTVFVDRTTGLPSAYSTVSTPPNRLGAPAAKAGAPVVPRIGIPMLYPAPAANTDTTLRDRSVIARSGMTRSAFIKITRLFFIRIYIMCDLS
jgi:hypothetical protein